MLLKPKEVKLRTFLEKRSSDSTVLIKKNVKKKGWWLKNPLMMEYGIAKKLFLSKRLLI